MFALVTGALFSYGGDLSCTGLKSVWNDLIISLQMYKIRILFFKIKRMNLNYFKFKFKFFIFGRFFIKFCFNL